MNQNPLRVAVLICSDRAARGERADTTVLRLRPALEAAGHVLGSVHVVADEQDAIETALRNLCFDHRLVLTSGGTGVAPRDVTVEATRAVLEREIPGIGEAMRAHSLRSVPTAMLSRATAGVLGSSLIVNLPGSPGGAVECLAIVLPVLKHACAAIAGSVKDCKEDLQP